MSILEAKKLYQFIVDNHIDDFPKITMSKIHSILIGKEKNSDLDLTDEEKELIISTYKSNPKIFDDNTPSIILKDEECIMLAIDINLESLSFLDYFYEISNELMKKITEVAKKKRYVISKTSPSILRRCYEVVLNSIMINPQSADYIEFDYIWYKDSKKIINILSQSNFILTSDTPEFLVDSEEICLTSLRNDFSTSKYLSANSKKSKKVFKYLLENRYNFTIEELENIPISFLEDDDILNFYLIQIREFNFEKLDIYQAEEILKRFRSIGLTEEESNNFNDLIKSFIKKTPTIKTINKIWQEHALNSWNRYRTDHPELYTDLFNKITNELRVIDNFEDIFKSFHFLDIKLTIPNSYEQLINAMREYFEIYHKQDNNYLQELQRPASIISNIVGLYIVSSKEKYIKDEVAHHEDIAKPFFKLKMDNNVVQSKIVNHRKRKIFEYLYINSDESVKSFIDGIIDRYKKDIPESQLRILITAIVRGFKYIDILADIQKKPKEFESYELYKKVLKIIKRLNQGYLDRSSIEYKMYMNYIIWDDMKKSYIISPDIIGKRKITKCRKYEKYLSIYKEIRSIIANRIKEIEFDGYIGKKILDNIRTQLPFTDEYFEFDTDSITLENTLNPKLLIKHSHNGTYTEYEYSPLFYILNSFFYSNEILGNKEYLDVIYNIFIRSGIAWLLIIEKDDPRFYIDNSIYKALTSKRVFNILNNIPNLLKFANIHGYNIDGFSSFNHLNNIAGNIEEISLAMIGLPLSLKLHEDKDISDDEIIEIMNKASYLIAHMANRKNSTVPYISGTTTNYHYSTYNSNDSDLLLAGIDTSACFKINSTDNDFLFYTALDKNGFAIKITDRNGNFIARACGFRNGNFIFLNQLRTIYDKGNNEVSSIPSYESIEIIEALKKACEDIIKQSEDTKDDSLGIDAIFITKSYLLKDFPGNIVKNELLGKYPMDNNSDDWKTFVKNTPYLKECTINNCFTTDFESYPLICIATSKSFEELEIKSGDVDAVYRQPRLDVIYGNIKDRNIFTRVNRIAGIKAFLNNSKYEQPSINDDDIIFAGQDWFIITNLGNILMTCIIDENPETIDEMNASAEWLKINLETIAEQEMTPINHTKSLPIKKKLTTKGKK